MIFQLSRGEILRVCAAGAVLRMQLSGVDDGKLPSRKGGVALALLVEPYAIGA